MINGGLFYFLAFVLVVSSFFVILAKNPVHAVLSLVLAFVTSSCLWLLLNAEFMALLLIVIYVGAVTVLFLFVVMMLDIDIETIRRGFWSNLPYAVILGIVILGEMVSVFIKTPLQTDTASGIGGAQSSANTIGWILYTQYSYPVELASLILLLGLVAAVALTLRKSNKGGKYQNIPKQLRANKEDRLVMVKMKPEIEETMK